MKTKSVMFTMLLLSLFVGSAQAAKAKKRVWDVTRLNCSKDFGNELDLQAVVRGDEQLLRLTVAKKLAFELYRFPNGDPEKSDYRGAFTLKFDGDAKAMNLEGSAEYVNPGTLKITGIPETFSSGKGAHFFTARLELNGTACKVDSDSLEDCKHPVSLNLDVRCQVYMTDTMAL